MFGFRAPRLPVTSEQKAWVDRRMDWLTQEFGESRLRAVRVIHPTPEFFPDPYHGKAEDLETMFRRVCEYMAVDSARIEPYLYCDEGPQLGPGLHIERERAAGLYHHGDIARIGIEAAQLTDPMSLVATIAHELGHVLLLGDGRISREEADHEPLTDLLTVFLGMGIFGANACFRDSAWSAAGWHGWRTSKLGYLPQPVWGYALALFALRRNEPSPDWLKHLRPDIRAPFKASRHHLSP